MENFININVSAEETKKGSDGAIENKIKANSKSSTTKRTIVAVNNVGKNNENDEEAQKNRSVAKTIAINVIGSTVDQSIDLASQYYQQRSAFSGDSARTNALNNTLGFASKTTSSVTSALGFGASLGSKNAVLIASQALNLAVQGINLAIENSQKVSELKWEIQEQYMTSARRANRLGVVSSSRGRYTTYDYKL